MTKKMGALEALQQVTPAPREPTAAEAQAAHNKLKRINAIWRQIHQGWIELAEELHAFHATKGWVDLGYNGFQACIADKTGIKVRWAYNLVEVWEHLVVRHGVDPARLAELPNVTNVTEGIPALRRGMVDVDELLADATALPPSDFREHYRPSTSPAAPAGAHAGRDPLDAGAEPAWFTCDACGSRVRRAA